MQLSVLIPVYRLDAGELLQRLHTQLEAAGISYEILVFDDSGAVAHYHWHAAVSYIQQLTIYSDTGNKGRSSARNHLLSKASGNYVLFLDGDMAINEGFISAYLREAEVYPDTVLLGGIRYEGDERFLRVRVGKVREALPANIRQQFPFRSFTVANALLPRHVLSDLRFDESIKGYGHEDTLFGLHLQDKGVKIKHLDNPAVHTGIDDDQVFLRKTDAALETLAGLYHQKVLLSRHVREIRLLHLWQRLHAFRIPGLFAGIIPLSWLKTRVLKNSSLYWFDLYKLHRLHSFLKQKQPQSSL